MTFLENNIVYNTDKFTSNKIGDKDMEVYMLNPKTEKEFKDTLNFLAICISKSSSKKLLKLYLKINTEYTKQFMLKEAWRIGDIRWL